MAILVSFDAVFESEGNLRLAHFDDVAMRKLPRLGESLSVNESASPAAFIDNIVSVTIKSQRSLCGRDLRVNDRYLVVQPAPDMTLGPGHLALISIPRREHYPELR